MSDIKIKTYGIDFQFLGAEVLEKCPEGESKYFIDGYLYYTHHFFESLSDMVPLLQIEDGYSLISLSLFIKEPLTYINYEIIELNNAQKKEFLEGFDLGMQESCKAIQLALNPVTDKAVA